LHSVFYTFLENKARHVLMCALPHALSRH